MTSTSENNETDTGLDELLNQHFAGKVVRKDLTKLVKEGANVPVYVLEYLLGNYCASNDPEVIDDGVTGLLFETENVDDLESKMRTLLQNEALRQKMGIAGRKRVQELFSEEVYTRHFVEMIDQVMTGNRGGKA